MCLVKLAKFHSFYLKPSFYRLWLSYLMLDQLERDNLYEDFIYLNLWFRFNFFNILTHGSFSCKKQEMVAHIMRFRMYRISRNSELPLIFNVWHYIYVLNKLFGFASFNIRHVSKIFLSYTTKDTCHSVHHQT